MACSFTSSLTDQVQYLLDEGSYSNHLYSYQLMSVVQPHVFVCTSIIYLVTNTVTIFVDLFHNMLLHSLKTLTISIRVHSITIGQTEHTPKQ